MSTVPASIRAAIEPQVNLLPPEVEARRALGRKKGAVGLGFGAFLVVLGLAVYWASSQNAAAQRGLTAAVDDGAALQAEIDTYAYLSVMEAELLNARNARTYVGATEVNTEFLYLGVVAALPSGTMVESLTLSTISVAAQGFGSVDASGIPDIGSVQITGQSPTYVSGGDLEDRLNEVPGLFGASISSLQRQDGADGAPDYYAFDGTARMNALVLSGRYSAAWLEQDAIDQAIEATSRRLEAAAATDAPAAVEPEAVEPEAGEPEAGEESPPEAPAETPVAPTRAEDDAETLLLLYAAKLEAEGSVLYQQEAVEYGGEGAEADLALAEVTLGEIVPVLNTLAAAVNAWDGDATRLATIRARIAAAEDYVVFCEERVTTIEAAVAEDLEGADVALALARLWLLRAEYGVTVEKSFLEAAEVSEAETRSALDQALVAAAALVGNASVGEGA